MDFFVGSAHKPYTSISFMHANILRSNATHQSVVVLLGGHIQCPPGLLFCLCQLHCPAVHLTGLQLVQVLSVLLLLAESALLLCLQRCPIPGEKV